MTIAKDHDFMICDCLSVVFEVMVNMFDAAVEVDPFTNVGILLSKSFLCT
jgi:hypothetical protein